MRVAVAGEDVYAYTASRHFDAAQPTVVFVHGAANDHSVWALQSRYFAYHGRNVLAVDLPGHGRSGGGALATVEAIARWLAALLDALQIDRAALVGHSLGALAALHFAGQYPGRVAALALLGAAAPMQVSETLLAAAGDNALHAYELITSWSFSPAHQLGGNRQPGVWMAGSALRLMQRLATGVLQRDLLACHQYVGGLDSAAKVRCPVLLVMGERDLMAPPRNAQRLVEILKTAEVVVIPGCGHSLMVEAPDMVLDALCRVL
jgi:pimeloyl-ACP methyl ester carboxylesterase